MKIEWNNLTKGQKVWYAYSLLSYAKPSGPFKVVSVTGSYNGQHVTLSKVGETRDVHLVNDEDYGEPVFYDNPDRN